MYTCSLSQIAKIIAYQFSQTYQPPCCFGRLNELKGTQWNPHAEQQKGSGNWQECDRCVNA